MIRKIIQINEEKCNGCGACAAACHEGAIGMVDGKAKLLRDDYCDGLGDCLPACPTGAITFVEREAAAYDEKAVQENMRKKKEPVHTGCPGHQVRNFNRAEISSSVPQPVDSVSRLGQWPCQIKLVPVNAPYFNGAELLIAADCTAYALCQSARGIYEGQNYADRLPEARRRSLQRKLTQIIQNNEIQSVTIVRMEVPCCGGLEMAAKTALQNSGKFIPWQVVIISTDGKILDR